MIIKKFQGKTEAEAVESAKKELGSNVVIMNVRNMKRKGMFSFLKPQLIEVTAALEEEPSQSAAPQKEEARPQPFIDAIVHKAAMETAAFVDGNIARDQQAENGRADSSAIEEKLDTLHTLLEQQLQKPDEMRGDTPEEDKESEVERFMKLLYNTMLANEVSEQNANQIIDEIEKISKPNMPFDYALANLLKLYLPRRERRLYFLWVLPGLARPLPLQRLPLSSVWKAAEKLLFLRQIPIVLPLPNSFGRMPIF